MTFFAVRNWILMINYEGIDKNTFIKALWAKVIRHGEEDTCTKLKLDFKGLNEEKEKADFKDSFSTMYSFQQQL
jgi:hypothetical protein